MIQKARLVQLAEMDLSVVMLDGQLANDAQEMATELLNYQWRDAKVELPEDGDTVLIVWRGKVRMVQYHKGEDMQNYSTHWMPLPPLPE
jgi:hypothetical protein